MSIKQVYNMLQIKRGYLYNYSNMMLTVIELLQKSELGCCRSIFIHVPAMHIIV